ncbi:SDR family oxidoreductase [Leucobacter sp. GX24907]
MTDRPIAIVTGASGGMGGEIVRELSRTHRVIAIGRNQDRLGALASETDGETWRLDVTDEAGFVEHLAPLERLDVLVHAAAVSTPQRIDSATAEAWQAQFATNVIAPVLLTRHALPKLREAQGTVIFIGSGASTRPVPGNAVYTASKHALRGAADVLRIDEAPHRLRVATIAPGQTDTAMLRSMISDSEYEPERYIRPASVAGAVRFVVDAPTDVHITDIAVRPRQEISRL